MTRRLEVPAGSQFGRLTVLGEAQPRRTPSGQIKRYIACRCECGTSAEVALTNLVTGKSSSCGCGEAEARIKHGLHGTHLCRIWYGMHSRCRIHPGYAGRGLTVADEWHGTDGLKRFVAWAKENGAATGKDIDRRDNDVGYSPDNCRFVSRSVNQRNKRDALLVAHPDTGEMVSLMSLWESRGNRELDFETVRKRINLSNWPVPLAISKPSKIRKKPRS